MQQPGGQTWNGGHKFKWGFGHYWLPRWRQPWFSYGCLTPSIACQSPWTCMIARSSILCTPSGDIGWRVRDGDVEEKGARTDPCWTPFLRRHEQRFLTTRCIVRTKEKLIPCKTITSCICKCNSQAAVIISVTW